MQDQDNAVQNTDREVYRSPEDVYGRSAERVLIIEGGGVGIDVNGSVYVKPVADWHSMAEHQEKARYAQAAMQSQAGAMGAAYAGPNVYQPSEAELAEQKEYRRKYEELELRKAALGSAIQYATGRQRASDDIVRDAQAFLDFLTVK